VFSVGSTLFWLIFKDEKLTKNVIIEKFIDLKTINGNAATIEWILKIKTYVVCTYGFNIYVFFSSYDPFNFLSLTKHKEIVNNLVEFKNFLFSASLKKIIRWNIDDKSKTYTHVVLELKLNNYLRGMYAFDLHLLLIAIETQAKTNIYNLTFDLHLNYSNPLITNLYLFDGIKMGRFGNKGLFGVTKDWLKLWKKQN